MRISDWSSDVCSSDLLDEQRPGFASQLVRVDIAGDIVLRADTRCLGVDILSTDRRGVPVGRGNGHHSINGPVDQIRSIERYAIVLVLKLFLRSEEHTSELQSLMRISYAVFCLNKKKILSIEIESTLQY